MKDHAGDGVSRSISEQAAGWFVRLLAGDMKLAERRAYLEWLKVSPVHIAEFLRICQMYTVFRTVGLTRAADASKSNIIKLGCGDETVRATAGSNAHFWRARFAAATAVVGLVVFIGFLVKTSWLDRTISTEAGEWRTVTLTDGTTMRVGPRTSLRTRFSDAQRIIDLSNGELIVDVAKERARPFSVRAGDVIVTATGTQFAVDRQSSQVVVTVAEGRVRVDPRGVHTERSVALRMGDQIMLSGAVTAPVGQVNIQHELAWAARRLVFESETVQEAVNEFNRRNRLQLVVDPALRAKAVRGGFEADNPESFARSLAAGLHGRLVWKSPQILSIESSSGPRP